MQIMPPIVSEDVGSHVTFTAHMQAVQGAIQVMHSHLHELLTLEDLASVACLSPYHFNRVFRRLIGIPPGEFLSALRLQKARRLLLTTPLSVTDICFEVGYTSTGSFTSRFAQAVGLSPRMLRQRSHQFDVDPLEEATRSVSLLSEHPQDLISAPSTLYGSITAPANFRGVIYVGLFRRPLPQGAPVRCTRLNAPGSYLLTNVPDGVYYLLSAAFPMASNPQAYLSPGEKQLVAKNSSPLIIHNGHICGISDLTLRPARLTDPPLVMGLPLL
ncbi:AraC family transcriptional regulator [Dictyobacter alpinus]|uniref:AraC family transcriptional regulator n=1 Tax=Dictyobacter alpinus TaxID=2014873 RepID=A0A402BBB7_9CHLR|nr:helix-turn-helix transcriptional regulator [Dictyobacter alpinus]GCE28693.1 AraC family transcriptional regulator [Dictyobacter alpinus]